GIGTGSTGWFNFDSLGVQAPNALKVMEHAGQGPPVRATRPSGATALLGNLVHGEERHAERPPRARHGDVLARMPVALAPAIGERDVASTAAVPRFQGPPREVQPAPQRAAQCDEQREAGTF